MPELRTIEIDFEVHKIIELERTSFSETANEVLRWLRFFGQSGDPVKVYSVCRSCRQNAFESISFPLLLRLWGCGQGA